MWCTLEVKKFWSTLLWSHSPLAILGQVHEPFAFAYLDLVSFSLNKNSSSLSIGIAWDRTLHKKENILQAPTQTLPKQIKNKKKKCLILGNNTKNLTGTVSKQGVVVKIKYHSIRTNAIYQVLY